MLPPGLGKSGSFQHLIRLIQFILEKDLILVLLQGTVDANYRQFALI